MARFRTFIEKQCKFYVFQLPEHLWRFWDILIAELKSEIPEIRNNFKLKYNDVDGAILKVRGADDFEKFSERLENTDENEEIVLILENISSKNDESSGNSQNVRIFPSELQRGKYVGNGMHATVRM